MAENHPVGFRLVVKARERGATVIHVDPRFNRTSAMADIWVPLRAGSDLAFLGGMINYVLQNGRDFRDYVVPYTNAATIIREDFKDTEDLGGLFSGWDEEQQKYVTDSWLYAGDGRQRQGEPGDVELGARAVGQEPRRPALATDRRTARRDAAASALRLPDSEASLRALHAGVGRAGVRHAEGSVPARRRRIHVSARAGEDRRDLLCRRLDAALDRRADHPRGGDPAAAARQHRTSRRRHHGAARPRVDPGIDRHPDALRHHARLSADAELRSRARTRCTTTSSRTARRPAGGTTSTSTSSAC